MVCACDVVSKALEKGAIKRELSFALLYLSELALIRWKSVSHFVMVVVNCSLPTFLADFRRKNSTLRTSEDSNGFLEI